MRVTDLHIRIKYTTLWHVHAYPSVDFNSSRTGFPPQAYYVFETNKHTGKPTIYLYLRIICGADAHTYTWGICLRACVHTFTRKSYHL